MSQVNIRLLDKSFAVNCPEGEEVELHLAVQELEKRLNDIKKQTNLSNREQLIIMASLNLSHDLLKMHNRDQVNNASLNFKIQLMVDKLDHILSKKKTNMSHKKQDHFDINVESVIEMS